MTMGNTSPGGWEAEQILRDQQMRGGGDRQELCQPLDDAKKHCDHGIMHGQPRCKSRRIP